MSPSSGRFTFDAVCTVSTLLFKSAHDLTSRSDLVYAFISLTKSHIRDSVQVPGPFATGCFPTGVVYSA